MPSTAQNRDYPFRFRYETLRSLLNKNGNALQILSDLEADLNHMRRYDERIKLSIRRLIAETLLMAQELNLLTANRHSRLYQTIFRLRNETDRLFVEGKKNGRQALAMRIDSTQDPGSKLIGGKAAGVWLLGKHFKNLVPPCFVVTTAAYNLTLDKNGLHDRVRILLNNLDVTADQDQFRSRIRTIRRLITKAHLPEEIEAEIRKHASLIAADSHNLLWAVRSSAVCEDGERSFAGQFDSELCVKSEELTSAYLRVLAGRFSERAVRYRINGGFREIDTPMAVLFMPMIETVCAGVAYTSDVNYPNADTMVINSVAGLADKMIKGEEAADVFFLSKSPLKLIETIPARESIGSNYIDEEKLLEIAALTVRASEAIGHELDVEWAVGKDEKVYFLQARRLVSMPPDEKPTRRGKKNVLPLLKGGITIFPGRAEGPVKFLGHAPDISDVPEGVVLVAENPGPEFAPLLPKIAALLVVEGNPVGHLATLVREFSVPCIFRVGPNARILFGRGNVSVNAADKTVYTGTRWPGIRERVLARISAGHREKSGPLYDLVLNLNLTDPDASTFKAKSCRSVHDTLRFMHEMSVRSMFGFGDEQKRAWRRKSTRLNTNLPIKFQLIDLENTTAFAKSVEPPEVTSLPFQSLWRGFSDKKLFWPNRWEEQMRGMPANFRETVLGGNRGPRRAADANYAIVARDYMNLNARFAYHYAMVDAMVGPGAENNYVHFRFRGGGAGDENRVRRVRFLEIVLRQKGFGVDLRGDLLTAWFRRYPQKDCENSLEMLGRLMVCAGQLDAVLKIDVDIKLYADYFLKEEYGIFA